MRARFLRLTARKAQELSALKREAAKDGAHRVARRIHAVLLNHQHYTSGEIAQLLEAPRSKVSLWLGQYESYGWEALLEGHRSGRPKELIPAQGTARTPTADSDHGSAQHAEDFRGRGPLPSQILLSARDDLRGIQLHRLSRPTRQSLSRSGSVFDP